MKLERVDYLRPATEAELADALARHGARAAVLAGGQSLIPQLALRARSAGVLVDVNMLPGAETIRLLPFPAATLWIGLLARHRDIAVDPLIRTNAPMLATAASHIGNPEVRNRGTLCGSLAHADPAAEFPLAAVALDARIVLRSSSGEREVAADSFFTGAFETVRRPDEYIAGMRVAPACIDTFHFFDEIGRRPAAPAFATLALNAECGDGAVRTLRLAMGGATGRPRLLPRTGQALAAAPGNADALRSLLRDELGVCLAAPERAYRLHLATTLLDRARHALLQRLQTGTLP